MFTNYPHGFQMILSCLCMISGVIGFGFVTAYFFASVLSSTNSKSKFQDDLDGVKDFLLVSKSLLKELLLLSRI